MSPVTEASIRPTSGQRTSTDSTITTAYAVFQRMPGRKTSLAWPVREAKTAAIAMPTRLLTTNCTDWRCTSRTASSATARPMPTMRPSRRLWPIR